jgi:hypothetical protein
VSSQWTANGAKLHYNTGNVGIGTSNPQSKVDIAGNAVIGATYSGTSAGPANGLAVEGKLGVGTLAPVSSASLEVSSTTTGVLLPRMTRAQRNAIATPAEGLMVYCLNCGTNGALSIFTNGAWFTFSPCTTISPVAGTPVMSQGQVIWNWMAVSGAAGYKWNTVADYETATDMGSLLAKTETGTVCDITYTRFVWAYSSCGESAMTTLTATVPAAPPVASAAGTHTATQTSVTWNWLPVAGATGYKWNIVNDFATATEMGTTTTHTETGLLCGTPYTRFVWAYNNCGFSSVTSLSKTSVDCVVLPTVTTTTITSIAQTSATGGGNVTSDGGGTITERGVCWSTSQNPTIADSKTIDGSGNGVFASSLAGLIANTPYYVRAYATNSAGTSYGDQVMFSTIAFVIGQAYAGGIIFWVDAAGQHGLISATSDQSTGSQWGCYGTPIGGTSTAIGTGQANTTAIVNGCSQTGIAARICNDLVLNGYEDWFLPSRDELNQMYVQRTLIGGFAITSYWSSSEFDLNSAYNQAFSNGNQGSLAKDYGNRYVRAVRAF